MSKAKGLSPRAAAIVVHSTACLLTVTCMNGHRCALSDTGTTAEKLADLSRVQRHPQMATAYL
jgi:hypothetical protein